MRLRVEQRARLLEVRACDVPRAALHAQHAEVVQALREGCRGDRVASEADRLGEVPRGEFPLAEVQAHDAEVVPGRTHAGAVAQSAESRQGLLVAVAGIAGTAAAILAAALLLERWPSTRDTPRFRDALDLGGGTAVFVSGASVREDFARVQPGEVDLLVRSRAPLRALAVTVEGEGRLRLSGRAPLPLSPRGITVELPLDPLVTLAGRRGVDETLYRQRVQVDDPKGAVLRFRSVGD